MRTGLVLAALAATQLWSGAAAAQAGEQLITAVTNCRTIEDINTRVACYDRAADTLQKAVSAKDLTVMSRDEVAASRRSLFGLTVDDDKIFGKQSRNFQKIDTLDSTVTKRTLVGPNIFAVTLSEGSVWRMLENARIAPEVGDRIHINRGMMNGYFGSFQGARSVRIERVR